MNELLSIVQALSCLGVCRGTLYKLIREGELQSIKICGRRLIPRRCLNEFLERKLAESR